MVSTVVYTVKALMALVDSWWNKTQVARIAEDGYKIYVFWKSYIIYHSRPFIFISFSEAILDNNV